MVCSPSNKRQPLSSCQERHLFCLQQHHLLVRWTLNWLPSAAKLGVSAQLHPCFCSTAWARNKWRSPTIIVVLRAFPAVTEEDTHTCQRHHKFEFAGKQPGSGHEELQLRELRYEVGSTFRYSEAAREYASWRGAWQILLWSKVLQEQIGIGLSDLWEIKCSAGGSAW